MNCCPRVVFIDLDGVVWNCEDISQTNPPYSCFNDTLVDSSGFLVKLHSGVRDFLEFVRKHGLYLYVLSWNNPVKALEAIKCFKLDEYFNDYSIREDPYKYIGIINILNKMSLNLNPCQIIYIDDRDIHIEDIYRYIGSVVFIHMWKRTRDYYDLINYISELLNNHCREKSR